MHLTIKQTQAIDLLEDNITSELLFGGGAGGGKSALGCYWQLKRRLKYPETRGVIGRASLKTLKETTLNSFFQVCQLQGIKNGSHYTYNDNKSIIKFYNGSEILLKDLFAYPSDQNFDELGSLEITDAFVDETNQIVSKAWGVLKSRIRYKLDENGLIPKMMGSCNPAKNWTYLDFYKQFKNGTLANNKAFIQSLLTDNPHISKHYRENLLTLDNNSKERLLYGNWEYSDDPSELMSYDKITDIYSNSFISGGEKYITADIARYGRDKTVIGVWDGFRLIAISEMAQSSIVESGDKIKEMAVIYAVPKSNIIVDEDGVGGGVVDTIKCKGFVNNSKALDNPETGEPENYNNLKSQCYFKLAEKVNKNEMFISCLDTQQKTDLSQELEQVKQHNMDKDTKKQVMPKEKVKELIGRSPDLSDMIMMRMYFTLTKPITRPKYSF